MSELPDLNRAFQLIIEAGEEALVEANIPREELMAAHRKFVVAIATIDLEAVLDEVERLVVRDALGKIEDPLTRLEVAEQMRKLADLFEQR